MRAVLLERLLLLLAVIVFFLLQMKLFGSQADCALRVTKAEESQRDIFQDAQLKVKQEYASVMGHNRELEKRITELETLLNEARKRAENTAGVVKKLKQELEEANKRAQQQQQQQQRSDASRLGDQGQWNAKVNEGEKDSGRTRGGAELLRQDVSNDDNKRMAQEQEHSASRVKEEKAPVRVMRPSEAVAAVVVMACNRPDYLQRTIDSILSVKRDPTMFPLYISQDGLQPQVKQVAQRAAPDFAYIQHIEKEPPKMRSPTEMIAYYRIAEHYKFALSHLFDGLNFTRVIVLEDDMELAPDFFSFFEAMAAVLDVDESLMAVSSWNDNGQEQFALDSKAVLRSDFFPGLGWMLRRSLWAELAPKWPRAYWDDWMRERSVRKGRQTVHPEVCRTYNFGKVGSSNGQFFDKYLLPIRLNREMINWREMDVSYLLLEEYNKGLASFIQAAKQLGTGFTLVDVQAAESSSVSVKYNSEGDFKIIAGMFGIFEEWKDGVPRTAYKGVVVFWYKRKRVFLIPSSLDVAALKAAKS